MMNVLDKIREVQNRAREDQRGVTLMELLIALALMSMLGFAMLSVFQSSVLTQGDVQSSTAGNAAAQRASFRITKDVRTAASFRVTPSTSPVGSRIDIKTPTGACLSYAVVSGKLVSKTSATPITSFSTGSKTLLEAISLPSGSSQYFTTSGTGVQYAFIAGSGSEKVSQIGVIYPRVLGSSSSPCW